MIYVEKRYENQKSKLKKQDNRKRLKYNKLIARIVKQIITNDNKRLLNNDIKQIAQDVYGKNDYLIVKVIKRMLMNDIVKNDINNELQRILTDAGLPKESLKDLYSKVMVWIEEKKDITNALKIAEKIERANNLLNDSRVNVSQTQIIDYSKLDREGNPAIKEVKKIETSTNNIENNEKSE